MSTKYQNPKDVPTADLIRRLDVIARALTCKNESLAIDDGHMFAEAARRLERYEKLEATENQQA